MHFLLLFLYYLFFVVSAFSIVDANKFSAYKSFTDSLPFFPSPFRGI